MSPRRVLHVSQPVTEGVANWVVDLVADQLGRGYEPVVACPGSSPLSDRVRALGAEQRDWAASRSPGPRVPDEVRRLHRIIGEVRPDLVHLHSSKAGLAGRVAMRGARPTVFQPHGWSFQATTGPLRRATVGWERVGSRWADRILCVSEGEAAEAAEIGIRPDRLAVVSNGVDLSRWPAALAQDTGGRPSAARPRPDGAARRQRRPAQPAEGPGPAGGGVAFRSRIGCRSPALPHRRRPRPC